MSRHSLFRKYTLVLVVLVTQLRSEATTVAIPVIALTAFAMTEDRGRFLEAGFDGYLSKPIDVRTLCDTVLSYCRQTGTPET